MNWMRREAISKAREILKDLKEFEGRLRLSKLELKLKEEWVKSRRAEVTEILEDYGVEV